MPFNKITENTICDCFHGAVEDVTNLFVRSVRKAPDLKDADFRTHFEREKKPNNDNDCDEVCGFHGVSIEIWNDTSSPVLLKKYNYSASISPKFKKNLSIIKFKTNNGLVKHTPNQIFYNEYHYDFYKEDSFAVSDLELVDMIPLTAV